MSPRVTGFLHTGAYNQCGCRILSLPHKCCIWVSVLTQQPTIRKTWTSKERAIVKFWWWQHLSVLARVCLESFSFQLRWNKGDRMCSLIWESSPPAPNKNQKSQRFPNTWEIGNINSEPGTSQVSYGPHLLLRLPDSEHDGAQQTPWAEELESEDWRTELKIACRTEPQGKRDRPCGYWAD